MTSLATACAHYNLSFCINFNGTEWQIWIISFLSKWANSKEDGKFSFADYTYKMYNLHIYIKLRQTGDLSMVYPTSHTMTLRLPPPALLMSEMPEANLKTWINKSQSNFINNKMFHALTVNPMPTVAENEPGMNLPWSNCTSRDVFPTPLSPTRIVCRKTHKIPQLSFLPLYIWSKYTVEAQSKLWWPLVIREQQEVAWLQSQLALKISLWLNARNHFIIFSCESTSVSWSTFLFPSSTDIFFSKSLAVTAWLTSQRR